MAVASYLNVPGEIIEIKSFLGTDIADAKYTVESELVKSGVQDINLILIGQGPGQELRTRAIDDVDIIGGWCGYYTGNYRTGRLYVTKFSKWNRFSGREYWDNGYSIDFNNGTITFNFPSLNVNQEIDGTQVKVNYSDYEFRYILFQAPKTIFRKYYTNLISDYRNDSGTDIASCAINRLNNFYEKTGRITTPHCIATSYAVPVSGQTTPSTYVAFGPEIHIGNAIFEPEKSIMFKVVDGEFWDYDGKYSTEGFLISWPGWITILREPMDSMYFGLWIHHYRTSSDQPITYGPSYAESMLIAKQASYNKNVPLIGLGYPATSNTPLKYGNVSDNFVIINVLEEGNS